MAKLELVPPAPKPNDDLLGPREVANMLGVELSWIKNHCSRTKPILPSFTLGEGSRPTRRFRRSEILQFIEDNRTPQRKRA